MPTLRSVSFCRTIGAILRVLIMMLLVCTCSSGAQSCPIGGTKDADWSKLAVQLCEESATKQLHLEAPSPDGKKLLYVTSAVNGPSLYLRFNNQSVPQEIHAAFGDPEALWSPDSKAVALTTCFGGNGPCSVETISVSDKGAQLDDRRPSPFEIVQDAFAVGHEGDVCYTEANIGALVWEDGSDKIVLIAQVPTAHCEGHKGGHLEAFVVSLPEGKVVSRVGMREAIRRWHNILGTGLQNDIESVRGGVKSKDK